MLLFHKRWLSYTLTGSLHRIWPWRQRRTLSLSGVFKMFLMKIALFWTQCQCCLSSMKLPTACCLFLKVRNPQIYYLLNICLGLVSVLLSCIMLKNTWPPPPFLQILNCTLWTVPVCHTAQLKTVSLQTITSFVFLSNCGFESHPRASACTRRFKLPATSPRPPGKHITDVAGVQSAGVGAQSAGERIQQLPAARHLKRDGYKAKRSGLTAVFTVLLVLFLRQLYWYWLFTPFSFMIHKNLRSTTCSCTISGRQLRVLWML